MDEDELSRRLARLDPQGIEVARERAKRAVIAQIAARERGPSVALGAGPVLTTWVTVALIVGAILVTAAVFTSPGRAVAGWVGERFGIGEPGGAPTLTTLRTAWNQGSNAEGMPAYVLARGPAGEAGRFEFITWRSKDDGSRCFEFDLVRQRSASFGDCGQRLPEQRGLILSTAGGGIGPDGPIQTFAGRASSDIEAVRVTLAGRELETRLTEIDPEVLEAVGFNRPFRIFTASTTDFLRGGRVEIVGLDAEGTELAREAIRLPDQVESQRLLCQRGHELLAKGAKQVDERSVRWTCEQAAEFRRLDALQP